MTIRVVHDITGEAIVKDNMKNPRYVYIYQSSQLKASEPSEGLCGEKEREKITNLI